MKKMIFLLFTSILSLHGIAQLAVSADKHYLIRKNGAPFFWLGDTAWELFHRLNRDEAKAYLKNRADKGFTVIQAVVLAELDGLNTPNANGDRPFFDNDLSRPNEAYFKHVDFIVNEANKRGLIMALLPSWGDKWQKNTWGKGPEIFTPSNAAQYGEWIGKRYAGKQIVWVVGGDRGVGNEQEFAIIRNMAKGIRKADPDHLVTFHPPGGKGSYTYFPEEDWLDFHMSQTGHRVASPDYKTNIIAYGLPVLKPHVNGEPNYEDHPNDSRPMEKGWMDDFDTRQAAYWNMLSGGAGHTYGNHNIWQMWTEKRQAVNNARTTWFVAMDQPGAYQVGYMRRMFEKRNWQKLVFDPSVIAGDNPEGIEYKVAAVSSDRDFMMIYIPFGQKTIVNMTRLNATKVRGWWFNPRDGFCIPIETFDKVNSKEFVPKAVGRGSDWVLVLDDAAKNYREPNAY